MVCGLFCNKCDVLVNPVTDAECHTIAEAIVGTVFRQKELIHWTKINRQLNRCVFWIPFCTALSTSSQSKIMIVAITKVNGGTNEPTEVASNG